jgi:MoCo/4Fe-4S cofactor protein with predicted Tat translocation signal
MDFQNKEVWLGVEDLTNDAQLIENAKQEFHHAKLSDGLSSDLSSNRRDFLKYLGFGIGAATLAASCETPLTRVVPFVRKPDTIVPGVATYYASSFVDGGDYAAILVKTREGRPIKIEGNTMSKVTPDGSTARSQAVVLSLYDTTRFPSAGKISGGKYEKMNWQDADNAIKSKLGAGILIVTRTILSPTTKKVIADFKAKYPNTTVVSYDAVSSSAILAANEANFGDKVIPNYKFDAAQVIVSFGADFLGTWISPQEYAAAYAKGRKIDKVEGATMSRHIQVESGMTMTGSNADNRILIKPSEQGAAIAALYNEVAALSGGAGVSGKKVNDKAAAALKKVAKELVENKGKCLVVSNSNNVGEQQLVNAINNLLGSYGSTIDFAEASLQRQGDETELMNALNGSYGAVFFMGGANPVYDTPWGEKIKAALSKIGTKVSFAGTMDETTALCDFVTPNHHLLEAWGDAEPKRGHLSLIQPTIAPIFQTRQAEETLLRWADAPQTDYHEYLKAAWVASNMAGSGYATPDMFWETALHDGVMTKPQGARVASFKGDVAAAAATITEPGQGGVEVSFFETVNIGDGRYGNNPWLQEMPDPVTRCTWGNTLAVPITWDGINDFNGFNNLKDGQFAEISANGQKATATAIRQFGQMEGTVAIALGYGRTVGSGKGYGTNVWNMVATPNGRFQYYAIAEVSKSLGEDKEHASVQYHHTMGVTGQGKEEGKEINVDEKALGWKGFQGSLTDRSVIFHSTLKELKEKTEHLKEKRHEFATLNSKSLYPGHSDKYNAGHHWNMHVDLNGCIGCGACTVACMSENNVPVVGKHEVHRHHEMSWLRIDRYFYGNVENPSTVYQPMMCQHCDNAPCENVCPVAATNHSHDGLNQMTYNRCIGTRYCANNCPFKVRRFNWLDYTTADLFGKNERYLGTEEGDVPFGADNLTRMVLNPDVTVRSRGVIEKCSFCVQRIQEGKLTAKREGRQLRDADVKSACQTACPTGAISFGDRNNPESDISKKLKSPILYRVIEETNVQPNVHYTMKVNNRSEELDA